MKNLLKKIEKVDFNIITTFILSFIFLSISVTSILFLIGVSISNLHFLVYILLSGIITYMLFRKEKDKENLKSILINILIAFMIIVFTILIANIFYDNTWDGNTYHKEMIGLMKNGMNPVFNTESGDIWTQHYARAVETFSAVTYSFTGNIESGKSINFLLMLVLFGQIIKYLRDKKVNLFVSIILAFIIALNPISLIQSVSYYVDGVFTNTLFLLILLLVKMTDKNDTMDKKLKEYFLAIITVIGINIKFTSLLICTMFIGVFILYWLYIAIKEKMFKKVFLKIFKYFAIIYIFGVILVGASVYVKNFVEHSHPFYPLQGEETGVDIVNGNEPTGLEKYSHVEKFIYTLFSKTYTWYDKKPELKIPFSVYTSELDSMQYVDTRVGGFGPLYSGILILSIPVLLFYLIKKIVKKDRRNILLIMIVLAIILPTPILPVVWQLRYYPQFYLLPLIALLLIIEDKDKNIIKNIYASIITIAFIGNVLLFVPSLLNSLKQSIRVNRQLIYLYEQSISKDLIISIEDCPNAGARYNLEDKNIKYKFLLEKMEDGEPMYFRFFYRLEERE